MTMRKPVMTGTMGPMRGATLATITAAIDQVRNDLLPVADDQKALLRRVRKDHEVPLASQEDWTVIATLLDRHFVLGYQNGKPWYAVHPLLADEL